MHQPYQSVTIYKLKVATVFCFVKSQGHFPHLNCAWNNCNDNSTKFALDYLAHLHKLLLLLTYRDVWNEGKNIYNYFDKT